MEIHGHGYSWMSMDVHGNPCSVMEFHGSPKNSLKTNTKSCKNKSQGVQNKNFLNSQSPNSLNSFGSEQTSVGSDENKTEKKQEREGGQGLNARLEQRKPTEREGKEIRRNSVVKEEEFRTLRQKEQEEKEKDREDAPWHLSFC